jgi:hypothetical protein
VIVEYASLVAAMAVLVSTVTGSLSALPTSTAPALTAVAAGAKAQKVPVGEARAAYKRAPYRKPVLKYLYAAGWIGGKKSSVSCLFARVQPDDTQREAAREIRRNPKLVRQLKRARVSVGTASATLVRGIASACS